MSYSFCFGPSGSGKSTFLRRIIIERARRSLACSGTDAARYIVIVPEQYSMQTQQEYVMEDPGRVLMNIDILSFGRLAHRVFEETGADRRTVLDEIGKSLLLRRAVSACAGDLQVMKRGIHRPGMIDEIKSVLSEFMQYGIGESELDAMASYAGKGGRKALEARLLDMKRISEEFSRAKEDHYVTPEETLELLAAAIPQAKSLKDAVIVFDGFTGFTTVQYKVLTGLIRCAKEVIFALTVSRDGGPDISVTAAGGPAGAEEDLFYLSRRTVRDILKIGNKENLARGQDLFLPARTGDRSLPRFQSGRVLAHLEESLFRYPEASFAEKREGETREGICLLAAATPREEVRRIFNRVRETIARTGCAYRDFAIVTADLGTYGDLFELEAARSGIPVYIDRTSGAFHNVLIEGIRSILQISTESFSYASVFRYLKSGLSRLTRDQVDLLENYCLANGIKSRKKWALPFDADCEEARILFLNEVRPVTGPVGSDGVPAAPGRTAAERTRELYSFLVGCRAQERMAALAESFAQDGDVVREKQYSQIYRAVIDLLDQIHGLAGSERMSARDYLELVEAGLAQIRLGTLPQRVDRVLVGDIERTRLTQIRHLFMAGVNEGNIPRGASRGGLLSDMDREFLASGGTVLAPSPRQQMFIQRLYLYMNMTKPSDTLTVSFAAVSQEGRSLRPSYLVLTLQRLFPALSVEPPGLHGLRDRVWDRAGAQSLVAGMLQQYVEGAGGGPEFQKEFSLLYGFLTSTQVMADPGIKRDVHRLRDAALFRYSPEYLSRQTALAVYGKRIYGGISRMETGARCMLRHHLSYGLGLRKRDSYEFEFMDEGTVLHGALQRFDGLLKKEGLTWKNFPPEKGRELAQAALAEEAALYRNLLLYKSARDQSQLDRFTRRLQRTVETLQYQICQGDFEPAASELEFGGRDGILPEIRFDLGGGRSLVLTGRIDRVDIFVEDGRTYFKLMDYKTGSKDLDPDQIRRGLQLQLITYMEALRQADTDLPAGMAAGGGQTVPSAMLYYRIYEPVLRLSPSEAAAALGSKHGDPGGAEEINLDKVHRALRPTGLVYGDDENIMHLDRFFTGASSTIPVTRTNSGGYHAKSHMIDAEEYRDLARAAADALCRIAADILDGNVTAAPAVIDQDQTACDYCPFREACGFDLRIPGYERRRD